MQSLVQGSDSRRNIDETIKDTFNNLGKRFVLVSRFRIKTWKSLAMITFVAGAFGALIWSVSREEMTKIYLAGENKVSNQATATFEDADGNKYGPVASNIVVTNIISGEIEPIKIKVELEGRQSFVSMLTLYVLNAGKNNIAFQTSSNSGTDGKLEINTTASDLPAGVYDFKIIVPTYLSRRVTSIVWPSEVEIQFDDILAGNLQDSDDVINSLDWSLLNEKWGTNDQTADINKDGIVNTLDWSLMNKNWAKSGS